MAHSTMNKIHPLGTVNVCIYLKDVEIVHSTWEATVLC